MIIKSFALFEGASVPEVPARFISLRSIGHYMDPEDGSTYAMLKKGGYEDEPYPSDEYLDEEGEAWEQLSDEEKAAVNSVWKSCEDIVRPAIDWDLISDIKDIALSEEVLDKGFYVRIWARIKLLSDPIVYCEWYGHDKDDVYYQKVFQNDWRILEAGNLAGSIEYEICILRPNGPGAFMPLSQLDPKSVMIVRSVMSRLLDMNPECRLSYSRW